MSMGDDFTDGGIQNGGEDHWSLLGYLRILRRRFWLVVPITMIAVCVGTIQAFRTPDTYLSSARLRVNFTPGTIPLEEDDPKALASGSDAFIETQLDLLRSRSIMELALKDKNVVRHFEARDDADSSAGGAFKRFLLTLASVAGMAPGSPKPRWKQLADMVEIQHEEHSVLYTLSLKAKSATASAQLVNGIADAFKDYHESQHTRRLADTLSMLLNEKATIQDDLEKAEKALHDFRMKSPQVILEESATRGPAYERLKQLSTRLTSVQLDRIALAVEVGTMQEILTSSLAGSDIHMNHRLFSVPAIMNDENIARERAKLSDAEKERGVLSGIYGKEHHLYQAADRKVDILGNQIKGAAQAVLEAQSNRLAMLSEEEASLKASIADQQSITRALADDTYQLTRLQNAVTRNRAVYDVILERMRQIDISGESTGVKVEILERGEVPENAENSNRARTAFIVSMLGFVLAFGLAIVIESLDTNIHTPEDLGKITDYPLLGFVPLVQKRNSKRNPAGVPAWEKPSARRLMGTIVLDEPQSSVAEAYRNIQAVMAGSPQARSAEVLCCTSSQPQSGKTTTVVNLALCFAQTGSHVLIIDTDLHRPAVHDALGLKIRPGLSDILTGEKDWKDVLQSAGNSRLPPGRVHVITAGRSHHNPFELISSPAMAAFLSEARDFYDRIFIDTPPMLYVSDASALSQLCNGVVVVVKAGTDSESKFRKTVERLERVNANVLGLVLNRARFSKLGRGYSTYEDLGYSRYTHRYCYYARNPVPRVETSPPEKLQPAEDVAPPRRRRPPKAVFDRMLRHRGRPE